MSTTSEPFESGEPPLPLPPDQWEPDYSMAANAPRFVSTVDDIVVWDSGLDDPPLPTTGEN